MDSATVQKVGCWKGRIVTLEGEPRAIRLGFATEETLLQDIIEQTTERKRTVPLFEIEAVEIRAKVPRYRTKTLKLVETLADACPWCGHTDGKHKAGCLAG